MSLAFQFHLLVTTALFRKVRFLGLIFRIGPVEFFPRFLCQEKHYKLGFQPWRVSECPRHKRGPTEDTPAQGY